MLDVPMRDLAASAAFYFGLIASALVYQFWMVDKPYTTRIIQPEGRDVGEEILTVIKNLVPNAPNFELLPRVGERYKVDMPIPLSKISFCISSCPKQIPVLREYFKYWKSEWGAEYVKDGVDEVKYTIYWGAKDKMPDGESLPKDMKIKVINQTNYHYKWALMVLDNIVQEPDVDWFYIMDDDTIPRVGEILRWLASYGNPRENMYFMHGPGERKSGWRLGNGGGGFVLSRKLVETILPNLEPCVLGMARRVINGDIRMDTCIRRFTAKMPEFMTAMFHFDPKVIRGDLTAIIEGFWSKVGLLSYHHIDKWKYVMFPKDFMDAIGNNKDRGQMEHIMHSMKLCGPNFLDRYVLFNKGQYFVMNQGYSIVKFPMGSDARNVLVYLTGVERIGGITEGNLYDELKMYLVDKNEEIQRYLLKSISRDGDTLKMEYANVREPSETISVTGSGTNMRLVL